MPAPISLFSVNALLILSTSDDASPRVLVKYYSPPHLSTTTTTSAPQPGANPYPTLKEQKAFEKGLLEKTAKQTSDVILYDNRIVVFKTEGDVMLYVVGGAEENEILLYSALLALRDSLNILLKYVCLSTLPSFTFTLHLHHNLYHTHHNHNYNHKPLPSFHTLQPQTNLPQKLNRQTHHNRKLRPRVPRLRRDNRRWHHTRNRSRHHLQPSQQAAGAGYCKC